jgi:hypothetical protein
MSTLLRDDLLSIIYSFICSMLVCQSSTFKIANLFSCGEQSHQLEYESFSVYLLTAWGSLNANVDNVNIFCIFHASGYFL